MWGNQHAMGSSLQNKPHADPEHKQTADLIEKFSNFPDVAPKAVLLKPSDTNLR